MKKFLNTLLLIALATLLHAQLNTTLLANLKYPAELNDIWGWVAPDGTEYALVGLTSGVSIVSLKDPTQPKKVAFVPGGNSIWRDLKTWGHYAYVTTDQPNTREGLVIIDLSQLPDTVTYQKWTPTIDQRTLYTCHNLYIEDGVAYLAGCNVNGGGILFVDIKSDPNNPVVLGKGPNIYAHDVFTRNDTMYTSEIYSGNVGFYDIHDKQNPIALAKQTTPFRFTHNTWLSDNGKVIFTSDEQPNASIAAYDISNLDNIKELDQFRPAKSLNTNTIPHNVHVKDDYLFISYYTDGGIIVDASRPDNLIEVGDYDTYPGANGNFHGAWGLYPFLPSGNILISDIETGLWVVKPTLKRACYLEGIVTDSITGQPIAGAQVTILSSQINQAATDLNGNYKTGQVLSGSFTVRVSKNNYYSKDVAVNLQNGELTTLNVKLAPISTYQVSGKVVAQNNNIGIAQAKILLLNSSNFYQKTADATGNFSLNEIAAGTYDIYIGAWGYHYKLESNVRIDNNKTITLTLEPGYEDNFLLDLGWKTFAQNASSGLWERAVPVGTFSQGTLANPNQDLVDDLGDFCYVTGNGGGSAGKDDVDGGPVALESPPIDLSRYADPVLTYHVWFFDGGSTLPADDSLVVSIVNGMDTITVEKVTDSESIWREKSSIRLRDFIHSSNLIKILFTTSDIGANAHVVEAAVDGFAIEENSSTPVVDPSLYALDLQAFPNPFHNQLMIRFKMSTAGFTGTIRLLNAIGQVVKTITVANQSDTIVLEDLPANAGVYWLQVVSTDGRTSEALKLIKL